MTDSGSDVRAGDDKPALSNLLQIYALLANTSVNELEARYAGKGYGAFKSDLAEVVVAALSPIQSRFVELEADPSVAREILRDGAERAREQAAAKVRLVRDRIGLAVD